MTPIVSPAEVPSEAVLLDARPAAAYAVGHAPNARHADLDRQLAAVDDPKHGGRHPLPPLDRWLALLGEWGITPSTPVVIYDDAKGANAAARAWWMLRAVRHEDVAVLDGDWRSLSAGADPHPASSYPATAWQLPTVGMAEVESLRQDDQWRVLDVRAAERYRGETEPIDPVAGHIPGAINLFFGENLEEGRFKSPEALREQYRALLGDVPPERVVVHCGSGVTACHTLLALEHAGLRGASLYVGSWSEWCRNH
ncbi:MAG TPA: sulfurtransferase [Thermoanaerobaculia bacterium]|jgi:thiosulfate/3-mercaptopyruvate sulfurtransferase